MKIILFLVLPLFVFSFASDVSGGKIHWLKMDTEEKLRAEFDKKIFPGSDIDTDYKILKKEKHTLLLRQGDTTILFDSPFASTQTFSLISRKWMCKFHFFEKKFANYSAEKGLMGP